MFRICTDREGVSIYLSCDHELAATMVAKALSVQWQHCIVRVFSGMSEVVVYKGGKEC